MKRSGDTLCKTIQSRGQACELCRLPRFTRVWKLRFVSFCGAVDPQLRNKHPRSENAAAANLGNETLDVGRTMVEGAALQRAHDAVRQSAHPSLRGCLRVRGHLGVVAFRLLWRFLLPRTSSTPSAGGARWLLKRRSRKHDATERSPTDGPWFYFSVARGQGGESKGAKGMLRGTQGESQERASESDGTNLEGHG